ncbi:hypothetical protein ACFFYR_08325 [Paraburkholderia dipogonis]|uniref:hypothetical protein n=1 Tax=Paraburkholderia dipogonis TaxID=1211383 RepID=UPI0035EAD4E8
MQFRLPAISISIAARRHDDDGLYYARAKIHSRAAQKTSTFQSHDSGDIDALVRLGRCDFMREVWAMEWCDAAAQ